MTGSEQPHEGKLSPRGKLSFVGNPRCQALMRLPTSLWLCHPASIEHIRGRPGIYGQIRFFLNNGVNLRLK